jgi:AraC-like DNA-binding protein
MITTLLLLTIQGIILSVLLLTKKKNRKGNYLLASFILSIVLYTSVDLLEFYWPYITVGTWIFPFFIAKLIMPVFLYLYVQIVIDNQLAKSHKPIFGSIIFGAIVSSLIIWLLPVASFDEFFDSLESILLTIIHCAWSAIFLIKATIIIRRRKDKEKNKTSVSWLVTLLYFVSFTFLFEFLDDVNEYFSLFNDLNVMSFVDVLLLLMVYTVSYIVLSKPQLFYKHEAANATNQPKYSQSTLSDEKIQLIEKELNDYMINQKPYLNGNLTIQNISDYLNIPRQYISQVLNDKIGLSFSDYLSAFRIEEFKQKANDPAYKNFTILALAIESGFNSKTSFNTSFKKHTGITPSEYIKQNSEKQ